MEDKENVFSSPVMNSSIKSPSDFNQSSLTPIRPLTAAYAASRGEFEVCVRILSAIISYTNEVDNNIGLNGSVVHDKLMFIVCGKKSIGLLKL